MLGFTVRDDKEVSGIQVAFGNDYNVTMWGYSNEDKTIPAQFTKCAVIVGKVYDPMLTFLIGHMEDATSSIMEKMGYTPSAIEIDHKAFIVNFEKYLEILQFVKTLNTQ